ncbi:hypothetical protein SHIRM173S_00934 [Streptomyces hirsutus]
MYYPLPQTLIDGLIGRCAVRPGSSMDSFFPSRCRNYRLREVHRCLERRSVSAVVVRLPQMLLHRRCAGRALAGNTFVVVQPDEDDHMRFASVAVPVEGGYGIVRRDGTRGEHKVTTSTGVNDIARDLGIWRAARNPPPSLPRTADQPAHRLPQHGLADLAFREGAVAVRQFAEHLQDAVAGLVRRVDGLHALPVRGLVVRRGGHADQRDADLAEESAQVQQDLPGVAQVGEQGRAQFARAEPRGVQHAAAAARQLVSPKASPRSSGGPVTARRLPIACASACACHTSAESSGTSPAVVRARLLVAMSRTASMRRPCLSDALPTRPPNFLVHYPE